MSVSVVSAALPPDENQDTNDPASAQSSEIVAPVFRSQSSSSTTSTSTSGGSSSSSSHRTNDSVSIQMNRANDLDSLSKFQWQKLMVCVSLILVTTAVVFAVSIVIVKNKKAAQKETTSGMSPTGKWNGTGTVRTGNVKEEGFGGAMALAQTQYQNQVEDSAGTRGDSIKCREPHPVNGSEDALGEIVDVRLVVLNSTRPLPLFNISEARSPIADPFNFNHKVYPKKESDSSSRPRCNGNGNGNGDSISARHNTTIKGYTSFTFECGSSLDLILRMAQEQAERDHLSFRITWKIGSGQYPILLSVNEVTEDPANNIFWTIFILDDVSSILPFLSSADDSNGIFIFSNEIEGVKVETKRPAFVFWLREIHVEEREGVREVKSTFDSKYKESRRDGVIQTLLFFKAFLL